MNIAIYKDKKKMENLKNRADIRLVNNKKDWGGHQNYIT